MQVTDCSEAGENTGKHTHGLRTYRTGGSATFSTEGKLDSFQFNYSSGQSFTSPRGKTSEPLFKSALATLQDAVSFQKPKSDMPITGREEKSSPCKQRRVREGQGLGRGTGAGSLGVRSRGPGSGWGTRGHGGRGCPAHHGAGDFKCQAGSDPERSS